MCCRRIGYTGGSDVSSEPARGLSPPGSLPFTATIKEAVRLSGVSRSELYRKLAAGDVVAIKSGRRTLIIVSSLVAHLANLPPAEFRPNWTAK